MNSEFCDIIKAERKVDFMDSYFEVDRISFLLKIISDFYSANEELESLDKNSLAIHLYSFPLSKLFYCKEEKDIIASIILFCTLGELHLTRFLKELMTKSGKTEEEQKRLLKDNLSISRRVSDLFKELAGHSWIDAMKKISKPSYNHSITSDIFKTITIIRNSIVHDGKLWNLDSDLSGNCLDCIDPLIRLFVDLHNEYTADKNQCFRQILES